MADPTQFLESNAILAAQQEDWVAVDRILAQMTESELDALVGACVHLGRKAAEWRDTGGAEL